MASPPGHGATSPPGPSPLALPRQRPTLALPGSVKSRKPSIVSNTSSAHPLRQTSFPPPDSLEAQHAAAEDEALLRFSPSQASQGSLDEFSDSEIVSAISGPAGTEDGVTRKRKRGEKRPRGRPAKYGQGHTRAGSTSLVNGDDGTTGGTPASRRNGTAGAPSVVTADNADDEDDEDEDLVAGTGRLPLYEGGQMSAAEHERDTMQKAMFRQYLNRIDSLPFTDPERRGMTSRSMGDRMDVFGRAKLRGADVRRLVNQTLSQSVPANVVTVVMSYTKLFAGLLIEEARDVQAEWMAVEEERANGESNPVYKRLKRSAQDDQEQILNDEQENVRPKSSGSAGKVNGIKQEQSSSPTLPDTQPDDHQGAVQEEVFPGGAGGLSTTVEECDRGPLLPDHLREALRRYKKGRRGGTVGFTGLSIEGRETAAPRMGGRRLFR